MEYQSLGRTGVQVSNLCPGCMMFGGKADALISLANIGAVVLARGAFSTLALDVTDESSMTRAVRAVEDAHGGVAVLINNAGYGEIGPLEELAIAALRQQMETNVVGALRLCQLVLPEMRRRGYGRIVNISALYVLP